MKYIILQRIPSKKSEDLVLGVLVGGSVLAGDRTLLRERVLQPSPHANGSAFNLRLCVGGKVGHTGETCPAPLFQAGSGRQLAWWWSRHCLVRVDGILETTGARLSQGRGARHH